MRLPRQSDRRLPWVAGFAVLVGVLLAASAAGADPTIQEKRSQAELILAQVQTLDEEVGAAAERFNGASSRVSAYSSAAARGITPTCSPSSSTRRTSPASSSAQRADGRANVSCSCT